MNKNKKDTDKIGIIDYGLLVLFFAFIAVLYFGYQTQNDFIVGYFTPISVCLVATAIFIRYITSIFTFNKTLTEKAEEDRREQAGENTKD